MKSSLKKVKTVLLTPIPFKVLIVGAVLLGITGELGHKQYIEMTRFSTYEKMRAEAMAVYANLVKHAGAPVPPLTVLDSEIFNAWYDGQSITLTTSLIKKLNSVDGIAFVMAHEMGHALLHHGGEKPYGQVDAENAADEIGAFIALRSGYNICEGREFFYIIAHLGNGDLADAGLMDHPSHIFRYNTLSMPWCPIKRFS